MEFFDLLPEDPKLYDKMRPPKKDGQATVVYFHVTVMGLDSIDENSMVSCEFLSNFNSQLFVCCFQKEHNFNLVIQLFQFFRFIFQEEKKERKNRTIIDRDIH